MPQNHAPQKISPKRAKELIESSENLVILDVRRPEEYLVSHIPQAILIPDYEISSRAIKELKDKNQLILIYCKSGIRSAKCASFLTSIGYTNICDFGGIVNWPYETSCG